MAGRMVELGFLNNTRVVRKRDQLVISMLKALRAQGHSYVELREDGKNGKRLIFFCTLCLARCHDENALCNHLKGNGHARRIAAAKATLLGPNPWPFSDGENFFGGSNWNGDDRMLAIGDGRERVMDSVSDAGSLAIVAYNAGVVSGNGVNNGVDEENSDDNKRSSSLVVPGVLLNDEVSNLEVNCIGLGKIAVRFFGGDLGKIGKIWCEWLGKRDPGDEDLIDISEHEFGIVALTYHNELGRKGILDNILSMLPSSAVAELENSEGGTRKRLKPTSEIGNVRGSPGNQYDSSSGEDSAASHSSTSSSRLLLDPYNTELWNKLMSSKTLRKEVRRLQREAAGRNCGLCQHEMIPGKDVGTILNMKTGKLACSSRNFSGAFHVYHISCLIYWILFCEVESYKNLAINSKVRRRSKRKNDKIKATRGQIHSVFCPECQGTGINIEGNKLENPTIPLLEMYNYKLKLHDAKRAWMENPEQLPNCSTGFYFPSESDESVEENVSTLKLLQFFGAVI